MSAKQSGGAQPPDPPEPSELEWTGANWGLDGDLLGQRELAAALRKRARVALRRANRPEYNYRQRLYRQSQSPQPPKRERSETHARDALVAAEEGLDDIAPDAWAVPETRPTSKRLWYSCESVDEAACTRADANSDALQEAGGTRRNLTEALRDGNYHWQPPNAWERSKAMQAQWINEMQADALAQAELEWAATHGRMRPKDLYPRLDRELLKIESRCSPEMTEACADWVFKNFPRFKGWAVQRRINCGQRGRKSQQHQPPLAA